MLLSNKIAQDLLNRVLKRAATRLQTVTPKPSMWAQVWAQGGFHVLIGSRDYTRGKLAAGEVSRLSGMHVEVVCTHEPAIKIPLRVA